MHSRHSGKGVFTRVHVVKEEITEKIGWRWAYDPGEHIMAPPLASSVTWGKLPQ